MLQETNAIVLRNKKYGETSCIVTMLTRKYGIQTYLINGVRKSTKKSAGAAMYFQPANILNIVAYHNNLKQLQRIKSYSFFVVYNAINQHAVKGMIALFITEVLYLTLKQPEDNSDLYDFTEDVFMYLDKANDVETANMPLYFLIHLSNVLGFVVQNNYSNLNNFLNLLDGQFEPKQPEHPNFVEGVLSEQISLLLKIQHPSELNQVALNQSIRRKILDALLQFYSLHIAGFSTPKSLFVLKEVLS